MGRKRRWERCPGSVCREEDAAWRNRGAKDMQHHTPPSHALPTQPHYSRIDQQAVLYKPLQK